MKDLYWRSSILESAAKAALSVTDERIEAFNSGDFDKFSNLSTADTIADRIVRSLEVVFIQDGDKKLKEPTLKSTIIHSPENIKPNTKGRKN